MAAKYRSFAEFRTEYLGIGEESKDATENYLCNCCASAWQHATELAEFLGGVNVDDLDRLLLKVNKVTCPHRHGNTIPKRDLDALTNFQVEVEERRTSQPAERSLDRLDKLFMLYLDEALVTFEQPHNCDDAQRLDFYQAAFRSVVGSALQNTESPPASPASSVEQLKAKIRDLIDRAFTTKRDAQSMISESEFMRRLCELVNS